MKFCFLIFISILFFSCEPGGPASNSSKNITNPTQDSLESYKQIRLDGYYKLEIPDDMVPEEGLNPLAKTRYFSEKYQIGLLILNENLESAKAGMIALNQKLEESNVDTLFIDHYMQFQINTLKKVVHGYDYPQVSRITLDEREGRTFEITADNDNDPIRRVVTGTVVEGRSQIYYIYLFYPAEKQETYRRAKTHILQSFDLDERVYQVESQGEIVQPEIIESKKRPKQNPKKNSIEK